MRIRLKCGGKAKRKKALFGMDGAITAAATLAAAAMTTAATLKSSKEQAKSIKESADIQSKAVTRANDATTASMKEQMSLSQQMNKENQDFYKDLALSGQLQAGQMNMANRNEASKQIVKYGGRASRKKLKKSSGASSPFYGGASMLFKVTDGGGVLPLQIDNNGYGLYEIVGNDHDHYHKAPDGKNKTGVGIKLANGSIIEAEGNQGTNQGELMYVTPQDAMFISKHSLKGFNPAQAVDNGMHPAQAFAYQEAIKDAYNIPDDGGKAKCGKRMSMKRHKAVLGSGWGHYGTSYYGGTTKNNSHLTFDAPGVKATVNVPTSISGITSEAQTTNSKSNFLNNYGGALINAGANLVGGTLNWFGNSIAGRRISKAYQESGEKLAEAYRNLKTIDESEIDRSDYEAPHTLAVIRDANTNIAPQEERINRDATAQKNLVNRSTLSSAARFNRIAGIDDRKFQRLGEQYAYKHNADEQIKQQNAQAITQTAQANADRDVQAMQNYYRDRLSLKQYNNDIVNQRIMGEAQSYADAILQGQSTQAQANQAGMSGFGSAIAAGGQAFSQAYDANRVYNQNLDMVMFGADTSNKVNYAIEQAAKGNKQLAQIYYNSFKNSSNPEAKAYADMLKKALS